MNENRTKQVLLLTVVTLQVLGLLAFRPLDRIASAQVLGDPFTFQVSPVDDWVQSWGQWTPGATITLTIEDGSGVVHADSQTADADGHFFFNLRGVFDLQRGHMVTVSDGTTTKTHTVTYLFVDDVDVVADTVSGRADAGTSVEVWVHGDGEVMVTADAAGNWTADFSWIADLTSLSDVGSRQIDDDGDSTEVWWVWGGNPVELVEIDIKPGSDPNCFNNDGHGVIPVAILGGVDFDASTVDPTTVTLDSAGVRVKGKSGNAGSLEDTNGDGFVDLVVQIEDVDGTYDGGSTSATLTGELYDGTPIEGSDSICIVP
jgi:hypothetical protein